MAQGFGLLDDAVLTDLDAAWRERESEAGALLAAGFPVMALALRLYSLEIRLKTIVCRRLNLDRLPAHCKTHDLEELLLFTGAWSILQDPANVAIRMNWDRLKSFSKSRLNALRYVPAATIGQSESDALIQALDDPSSGVWSWLSKPPFA